MFVARKTSDIALLLSPRGKSRSRSGFGHTVSKFFDQLLGRTRGRSLRDRRGQSVSTWIFVGGIVLAFAGGFLLGGQFGGDNDPGRAGLHANAAGGGTKPGFVGEVDTLPLASHAFVVSAYPNLPAVEAKGRAAKLGEYLRAAGLAKARPYLYPGKSGPLWIVAVYYDGDSEAAATRERLESAAGRRARSHVRSVANGGREFWLGVAAGLADSGVIG